MSFGYASQSLTLSGRTNSMRIGRIDWPSSTMLINQGKKRWFGIGSLDQEDYRRLREIPLKAVKFFFLLFLSFFIFFYQDSPHLDFFSSLLKFISFFFLTLFSILDNSLILFVRLSFSVCYYANCFLLPGISFDGVRARACEREKERGHNYQSRGWFLHATQSVSFDSCDTFA